MRLKARILSNVIFHSILFFSNELVTCFVAYFRGDIHSVVLGDHNLYTDEGTEQEMKVEAVYVHHTYRFSEDLEGDIALIKLK